MLRLLILLKLFQMKVYKLLSNTQRVNAWWIITVLNKYELIDCNKFSLQKLLRKIAFVSLAKYLTHLVKKRLKIYLMKIKHSRLDRSVPPLTLTQCPLRLSIAPYDHEVRSGTGSLRRGVWSITSFLTVGVSFPNYRNYYVPLTVNGHS